MTTKNEKDFKDTVFQTISKRGYHLFLNLNFLQDKQMFLSVAPDECLIISKIMPLEFSKNDIRIALGRLFYVKYIFSKYFFETMKKTADRIKVITVFIFEPKTKLLKNLQSDLFCCGVKSLKWTTNKNRFDFDTIFPIIKYDDNKGYLEYMKILIDHLEKIPNKHFRKDVILTPAAVDYNLNILTKSPFENLYGDKNIETSPCQYKSPREMADKVKMFIVGQDRAIERVAIPFFQHFESRRTQTDCLIKTSFILMGNTGTGKSEILRRFCEIGNVPIVRINTVDCVPYGWKGRHIGDYVRDCINNESDFEKMEYAVLVFNEFDKITHYDQTIVSDKGSDMGSDMQREILKFFDAGYELPLDSEYDLIMGDNNPDNKNKKHYLPTKNLLLCFDGAFVGIEKIIEKRLNKKRSTIGFLSSSVVPIDRSEKANLLNRITAIDLQKWGYMQELLSRIGTFITMNPMTEEMAYGILTTESTSENQVIAHKIQCQKYGVELDFSEKALRRIAKMVAESNMGARAIKPILIKLLDHIYFDCDRYRDSKLTVDEDLIELKFGQDRQNMVCKKQEALSI